MINDHLPLNDKNHHGAAMVLSVGSDISIADIKSRMNGI